MIRYKMFKTIDNDFQTQDDPWMERMEHQHLL